ncbi:relaxase/mobilization nuclease domain-containing protein [Streptomyces capparidis]
MIASISGGKSTTGLIRYLFDTEKAKDHTDPHLVASWDGFAPDPGRARDFDTAKKRLAQDLDLHVKQVRRKGRAPDKHVWHCSVRAAPEDRVLSDDEWAAIARRVVHATGIARDGDPDGCRWVAVRHADDHIHIAATTVRSDLRVARHWNDYLTADKELAAIEKKYGLREVIRGDRTAAKRPTRAEKEKAHRAGHRLTARERLRTTVRAAVAVSTSPEDFIHLLSGTGILVEILRFPSGDIKGYKVALADDTNAADQPVWFSGSALAPDLSFPKIRERLAATEPQYQHEPNAPRRRNPWHQATAAAERIPALLDQGDDAAAQAHLAAFGEALDALPVLTPKELRPHLRQAALTFERATRSRVRAEHHHARALRGAVRAVGTTPTGDGGALLAMFLDAALLVVIAAARWHELRCHDQQVAAARETLVHLQAAYQQAAVAPLSALAQRKPSARTVERHADQLRVGIPELAERVLADPGWDALATVLAEAEEASHRPEQLLQQAARQRSLNDAHSVAQVLTWRVRRLATRPAPSARARAAQARTAQAAAVAGQRRQAPVATPSQPVPTEARGQRR